MRESDATPPEDVDAYLARVAEPFAIALSKLRALIRATAPDAEEGISYGVPTYKWKGPLVSFGAASKHLAFYGMSPKVLADHAPQLEGFSTSPGTVRFTPDKPIPDAVIVSVIKARLAENQATADARQARKKVKP